MFNVNSKSDLIQLLVSNNLNLAKFGVTKIGIFGSFVKNSITENSDVDFYVIFNKEMKTYDNYYNLYVLLQNITGRKIDLVTPESLNKHIGNYILNEVEYVNF